MAICWRLKSLGNVDNFIFGVRLVLALNWDIPRRNADYILRLILPEVRLDGRVWRGTRNRRRSTPLALRLRRVILRVGGNRGISQTAGALLLALLVAVDVFEAECVAILSL